MTVRTRAELNTDADTNLADNSAGDISAADVRASVKNLADSAVLPGDTPYLVGVELGHATDTTVSRGAAGFIAVEGNRVPSPASQASGDILYRGTTEWERLAKGTAAQVLTMNAGATAPEWADAGVDLNALSAHTPIVDADIGHVQDSGASFANKKFTFSTLISYVLSKAASAANFRANTNGLLGVNNVWSSAAEVALTDAATIAVDMSAFLNATVTLAGNRTLGQPSNVKVGQSGVIRIVQDATGSRTLAYHADWEFAGGTAPVLSTAANAQDLLFYRVLAAGRIFASLANGVA